VPSLRMQWHKWPANMRLAALLLALLCGVAAAEAPASAEVVAPARRLWDLVTTPLPDEEQTVTSLSQTIFQNVKKVLDNPKYQWVDVVIALVFGLVLVKDGEFVFKWLVIIAVGLLGGLLALAEVSADLGSEYQDEIRYFISLEVGLFCAYAAWKGLDGVMLTVFALLGVFLAFKTQALVSLAAYDTTTREHKWIIASWYSFLALFTMRVYYKRKHVGLLAFVAPLIGGALVASALSWIATFAALQGGMDWVRTSNIVPQLQPAAKGSWVEFLLLLLVPDSKDVGVFANTQFDHPNWMHGKWCLDRVCGLSLWFLLFVGGTICQLRALKRQRIQEMIQSRQGKQGSGRINVQQMSKPKKNSASQFYAQSCPSVVSKEEIKPLQEPLIQQEAVDDVEAAAAM